MPVIIEGESYEIPTSFTLDELTIFKQNGGFTMQHIFEALEEMDPEAWKALIYVMRLRRDESVTLEQVGRMNLMDMEFTDPEGEAAEAGDVLPPGVAASAAPADAASPNGTPETKLAEHGRLASVASSGSIPGRWAS